MKMVINSHSHGRHVVFFDDEDIDLIKLYKWSIWKSRQGKYYAFHSWKREGEEVSIKMHRLVMRMEQDKMPLIDHIDGDTLNNRKNNLRIAVHSQNSMNRGKTAKNKSGYKGVCLKENRYTVQIQANKKLYHGGSFANAIDAAKRYDEMAIKYHGEFACLNFPTSKVKKCETKDTLYVQSCGDRKRKNASSFRGVGELSNVNTNKFRALININNVRINLGRFPDAITAAKAYDKAAKKYHGIRASLNFND